MIPADAKLVADGEDVSCFASSSLLNGAFIESVALKPLDERTVLRCLVGVLLPDLEPPDRVFRDVSTCSSDALKPKLLLCRADLCLLLLDCECRPEESTG